MMKYSTMQWHVVLNESGFDTGMTFEEYCEIAKEYGDDPSNYGCEQDEFVFVSRQYARQNPNCDYPILWPEDLPQWEHRL